MNRFMDSFRDACRAAPLAEKLLLVPSRRIGAQWTQTLARSGMAVVNVRVETTASLAMRIVAPALAERGLTLLPGAIGPLLAEELLREELDGAPLGEGSAEALFRTLTEIRGAGLTAGDLQAVGFASASLGQRILRHLQRYDELLTREQFIDAPGVFSLAAELLVAGSGALGDAIILCPATLQPFWTGGEQTLWRTLGENATLLDCDAILQPPTADIAATPASLRARLEHALGPRRESLSLCAAQGPAAEIRAVLRHCLQHNIPLDHVELLYTNRETYLPLSYEQLRFVFTDADSATFLEGLPAAFSRPGRLLLGLCDFLRGNYDQRVLTSLLADGLMTTKRPPRQLAATRSSLPIGIGRERWETLLPDAIAAADRRQQHEKRDDLNEIQTLVTILLNATADLGPAPPPAALLTAAATLLETIARCEGDLDRHAHQRLSDSIHLLRDYHRAHPSATPLDAQLAQLAETISATCVGAKGPQAGKLFVAPFAEGGHSGREHVFVVGFNDHHFPGALRQDPLLLDDDRQRIADTTHKPLPLSHHRIHAATEQFIALLGRCRGQLSLHFASHDLVDDRELYPAMILLQLCAILREESAVDLDTLTEHCGPAAAYLCQTPAAATTPTLGLLSRAAATGLAPATLQPLLGRHLRRAQLACDAWNTTDTFSAWNGKTAPAPLDKPPVFSASRLQTLAACPRKFFFQSKTHLNLQPPEELLPSPDRWLSPADFGTLLHDTFCEFYRIRLAAGKTTLDPETDSDELRDLLEANIKAAESQTPTPSRHAKLTTRRELNQAVDIFLREDASYQRETSWQPTWLEASIGLKPEAIGETTGTDLDQTQPVTIALSAGKLRIRGRIDRIDTHDDKPSHIAIWDYKTGSAKKYRPTDPFDRGRILQHDLYARLAEAVLPGRTIDEAGFYFTSWRGRGKRIAYSPAEIRDEGTAILNELYKLFATGTFPATTDKSDCSFCDYKRICGDFARVAKLSKQRLAECADPALDPFRTLRGVEKTEDAS